jgi:hypothetical protein
LVHGVTLLRKVRRHGAAAWLRTSVKSWCNCCSAASPCSFSPVCSFHYPSSKFPRRSSRKKFFGCANEPFARGYPAERGSGGARGETPKQLGASKTLNESHLLVYTTLVCQASSYTSAFLGSTILSMKLNANANYQFHFDECRQLFIPTHNVTLAIATMRVGNPDCLPVGIDSRDTAPTPTGSAKPVCDNFPAFHEFDGSSRCS